MVYVPPTSFKPLRLCITKDMRGGYVALSYCWGKGNTFKTTSGTIKDMLVGFDERSLPNLLRDAIEITRRMGFEWIWIDALCIIQDDLEDWNMQSSLMAQVYGNAAFTIAADLAQGTEDKILQPHNLMQSHNFGQGSRYCLQTLQHGWIRMCDMPLYQRGWALQERILSTRILHFLDDQIAWECNTTLFQESSYGPDKNAQGMLEDTVGHFAKNTCARFFYDKMHACNGLELESRIGIWNYMAQELAVREFTRENDRLPGVSGLASALEVPLLGRYLAGVWEHNPFLSMAWYTRYPEFLPSEYIAPSWSWAWIRSQLIWHWSTWSSNAPLSAVDDWNVWHATYGPRLLSYHMVPDGFDPKGRVMKGSSLTVCGSCRDVFVLEQIGVPYSRTIRFANSYTTEPSPPGAKVHMDQRDQDLESIASFYENFRDAKVPMNVKDATKYVCVQIVRERKIRDFNPKILALVLQRLVEEKDAYIRVGLYEFEATGCDFGWQKKRLVLY